MPFSSRDGRSRCVTLFEPAAISMACGALPRRERRPSCSSSSGARPASVLHGDEAAPLLHDVEMVATLIGLPGRRAPFRAAARAARSSVRSPPRARPSDRPSAADDSRWRDRRPHRTASDSRSTEKRHGSPADRASLSDRSPPTSAAAATGARSPHLDTADRCCHERRDQLATGTAAVEVPPSARDCLPAAGRMCLAMVASAGNARFGGPVGFLACPA